MPPVQLPALQIAARAAELNRRGTIAARRGSASPSPNTSAVPTAGLPAQPVLLVPPVLLVQLLVLLLVLPVQPPGPARLAPAPPACQGAPQLPTRHTHHTALTTALTTADTTPLPPAHHKPAHTPHRKPLRATVAHPAWKAGNPPNPAPADQPADPLERHRKKGVRGGVV